MGTMGIKRRKENEGHNNQLTWSTHYNHAAVTTGYPIRIQLARAESMSASSSGLGIQNLAWDLIVRVYNNHRCYKITAV